MPGIIINNLANELQFTEYHRRRGELRDALRHGVFPNLVKALGIYQAFVADYSPGGALHDAELWDYYLQTIAPIAAVQEGMMAGAQQIVSAMEAVERAAPGTFGIEVPEVEPEGPGPEPEPEPEAGPEPEPEAEPVAPEPEPPA